MHTANREGKTYVATSTSLVLSAPPSVPVGVVGVQVDQHHVCGVLTAFVASFAMLDGLVGVLLALEEVQAVAQGVALGEVALQRVARVWVASCTKCQ